MGRILDDWFVNLNFQPALDCLAVAGRSERCSGMDAPALHIPLPHPSMPLMAWRTSIPIGTHPRIGLTDIKGGHRA
jgi:hypothetical protein